MHTSIRDNVEGELVAQVPSYLKIFPMHQTSHRLVENIETAMDTKNWAQDDRTKVREMLARCKSVGYNVELHTINLHFYTRQEATKWAKKQIPFRNALLTLSLPAAHEKEDESQTNGTSKPFQSDGTKDDKYQRHGRVRLLNVQRHIDIGRLNKYLTELTHDAIKLTHPLDAGGPYSQWSLAYELVFHTTKCPEQLKNIHQIYWDQHRIFLHHMVGPNSAPCLVCAKPGHQVKDCKQTATPTPPHEDPHALVVTAETIRKLQPPHETWTTIEAARQAFAKQPEPQPTHPTQETQTPPPETKQEQDQLPPPIQPTPPKPTTKIQAPPTETKPSQKSDKQPEWSSPTAPGRARELPDKLPPVLKMTNPFEALAPKTKPKKKTTAPVPQPQPPTTSASKQKATIPADATIIDLTEDDEEAKQCSYQPSLQVSTLMQKLTKFAKSIPVPTPLLNQWRRLHELDDGVTAPDAATLANLLQGKRVKTPNNGNCQYYALAEAVRHRSIPETTPD